MADKLKFIHASDLHLDQPISGLAELPTHLIEVLANAPYNAAEKIFDLAVAEKVDFVLLAGDLFDFESGNARAAAFLLSQFQRLADREIHVYWCAGEKDFPDRWPSSIPLPENVVTFSSKIVEEVDHEREGTVVARIFGSGPDAKRESSLADFAAVDAEVFSIALTHGDFNSSRIKANHIRYWALGGRHKMGKVEHPECLIVYPGTPQGRTPKETGEHGFKLCRVDSNGKLRVQTIESDRVRWMPQKVAITETVAVDELKKELSERASKFVVDTTDQVVLARWLLVTEGQFNPAIRKPEWAAEILEWLRDEFGRSDKGLWSVSVKVEAPRHLPSDWYEEDTLLGEYLRAIGRYQSDESLRLQLHDYMPSTVEGALTQGISQVSNTQRENLLRQAAMTGIDYLAAHKCYDATEEVEA